MAERAGREGSGREGARRVLRLVAARRAAPAAAVVRFHPRLTVLTGFAPDTPRWLASLLEPGAANSKPDVDIPNTDIVVSLDQQQLPPDAVAAFLIRAHDPVLTADRLRAILADRATDTDRSLRTRADELSRRIAELQSRRRDITRRRSRVIEQLERARARAAEPDLDIWLHSEADALADEILALDTEIAHTRPSSEAHSDLLKWERVISEAHGRLARARGSAPRVDPIAVSHATRLRNEWRYLDQVADADRRRRSRRDAQLALAHYEAYLAQLGATSFDDLAVVGTGYGNSDADIAIREAAAVVSMAEQRCTALRAELAQPGRESLTLRREHALARTEALLGYPPGTEPVAALQAIRHTRAVKVDVRPPEDESELRERVDLATREHERLGAELQALERESGAIERGRLDLADRATKGLAAMGPVAIESLIGTAVAERPDTTMTRPLVVDDIIGALAPRSQHRAFAVLAGLSRSRQVIIVSRDDDVAQWTAELPTGAALIWSARQAEASA